MALNDGDIRRWSCTKLRIFFESRNINWMVDNLELSNVFALENKLRECSSEASNKIAYIISMLKHSIRKR